jgi:transposase
MNSMNTNCNIDPGALPRLGIDISKVTFDACLCLPQGATHAAEFSNNDAGFAALDAWLAEHRVTHCMAGLEATGPYGMGLLWHLHTRHHHVCQLNPRRVKDYARSQGRRVKTDQQDAALIAAYLKATEDLHAWNPPAQALADLQALVRRREQLLKTLQAERNRCESASCKLVVASLRRHLGQLQDELRRINKALDEHIEGNAEVQKDARLLRSIPGVGRMGAATILGEVPAISAFQRARDVAAFAGLTPALARSGTSVRRRGALTKEGSGLLRKMLYMAALQVIKRPTNPLHRSYKAMVERGKSKMCAIGALMHKIIRVAFGVLRHQTPFVEHLART